MHVAVGIIFFITALLKQSFANKRNELISGEFPIKNNSNEDDMDDDDIIDGENSKSGKSKDMSECASEIAEPSPGPSGSSETPGMGDGDDKDLDNLDEKQWPAINDLNTRLRRVITTYQRNYRKEEMKLAQKVKVIYL